MHSSMKKTDLIRWYLRGWSPWQHRWVRRGLLMGVYGRTRGRLPSEGGGCHAARRGRLVGFCRVWSEEPTTLSPADDAAPRARIISRGERWEETAGWLTCVAGRAMSWLTVIIPAPSLHRPPPPLWSRRAARCPPVSPRGVLHTWPYAPPPAPPPPPLDAHL